MKLKLTKIERDWVLYDVANSAFILIVTTTFMPIFFQDFASIGTNSATAFSNWNITVGVAALVLAILAPILGTFADYKGNKKKFWGTSVLLGILFTSVLVFVGAGQWIFAAILYVFARIFYGAANSFYDSFLPDVTEPNRMDFVSSSGFGWGYIGSVIPFLLSTVIVLAFGIGEDGALDPTAMKITFIIALVWWGLFSIPMLRGVKQLHGIEPSKKAVTDAFKRLWKTFLEILSNKSILIFLLAYFFYIDGVGTIISVATAYGRVLGFSATMLVIVVLFIQVVAWPFALLFGVAAKRFGRKPMIFVGIAVYVVVCFASFILPILPSTEAQVVLFWVMAFLVASSQGGIQAISRSYFAVLIPPEKSAEYFGFYNFLGKFAAILGPFLLAALTGLTGEPRFGVLSLTFLFLIGAIFLYLTPKDKKEESAG
jgi:UMF1 family MFS transporter